MNWRLKTRILAQHLLDDDQAAIRAHAPEDVGDEFFAAQRPDELQGEHQHDDRCVLDQHAIIEFGEQQLHGAIEFLGGELLAALVEHRVGIVDANESHRAVHLGIQCHQRRAAGTAQVVDRGAGLRVVGGNLHHHALDLIVKWHRPRDHVVEYRRDRFVETEIADGFALVTIDLVAGCAH